MNFKTWNNEDKQAGRQAGRQVENTDVGKEVGGNVDR